MRCTGLVMRWQGRRPTATGTTGHLIEFLLFQLFIIRADFAWAELRLFFFHGEYSFAEDSITIGQRVLAFLRASQANQIGSGPAPACKPDAQPRRDTGEKPLECAKDCARTRRRHPYFAGRILRFEIFPNFVQERACRVQRVITIVIFKLNHTEARAAAVYARARAHFFDQLAHRHVIEGASIVGALRDHAGQ